MAGAIVIALGFGACGTGQQFAAGPVVGYVAGRGWSRGWEAGGGPISVERTGGGDPTPTFGSLMAHANVGMSWRPLSPGARELERLTYAAWEPWLLAGGTLGVAHSSHDGDLHLLAGVWEAVPYVFGARGRTSTRRTCSARGPARRFRRGTRIAVPQDALDELFVRAAHGEGACAGPS